MACNFISVLSKLRKLSMESVENTASFDDFKKYDPHPKCAGHADQYGHTDHGGGSTLRF